jgi:WD40 repeat protein
MLASASLDGEVWLWNLATKRATSIIRVDPNGASGLGFSPDGKTLATSDLKGVRFWNIADGRVSEQIPGEGLGFLGFSESGNECLLSRSDGRHGMIGAVLDRATQAERFVVERPCRALVLSDNGRVIAAGDESGAVRLLDSALGHELLRTRDQGSRVVGVALSPNSKLVAAADTAGMVRVWETDTGTPRLSFSAGDPVHRWGPAVVAILVWIAATIRLNRPSKSAAAGAAVPM